MKKIVILLASLLLLIACTPKKKPETLVIGVMPSMDYLPLAVAAQEGYFEKLGVNVEIQKFYSANDRDAAFQSGNIDGTVIDYTGAVLQKAGGIKLRLVSSCDAPFYIIAGKDTGIAGIAGLKGKRVAVSQNTVIDYIVDMALQSVGLSAQDIEKVEINRIPLRFEMLRSGNIDATGLPDPLALIAIKGGDVLLATNESLGYAITGIMFTENAINTKSEQIKKMYEAYDMGVDYILSNPIENIKNILITDMGFTEEILPFAVLPSYTKARTPADTDIQSVIDWLAAKGLIGVDFDKATLIDRSIIGN